MELTTDLGDKIINETKRLINENIIIVNKQAIIIASTNRERIGHFHEGASETIKNKTVTVLTAGDEQTMQGVKAGINLPITIQGNVIGVIGITGNPDKVAPFGSLMQKMTELLIKENVFIQETEWKERIIERFVFDWLQANTIDDEFVKRAYTLGINWEINIRCILVVLKHIDNEPISPIISTSKSWLEEHLKGIVIKWEENKILILLETNQACPEDALLNDLESFQRFANEKLQTNTAIGIGNAVDADSLETSYAQAKKALKTSNYSIVLYNDLFLDILLTDISEQTKTAFINRTLQTIIHDKLLLQTLQAYLQNDLQLKTTAEQLHVHINTLHYRLNSIYERSGLNPKCTQTITAFYLAFLFLDEKPNIQNANP
ncbi:CdaR family transcriptional regulator [Virgibacillus sp. W0181]|uniref:CdaR family transcriptional regulator n=1 Tax=Virgibacillus sp. W0181 TaxID=3391581 RepID=UPI003F467802